MDWATEIAASLVKEGSIEGYDGCFTYFNEVSEGDVAIALRKAKASGMREAAEIAELGVTYIQNSGLKGGEANAYESASRQAGERIRAAADKIENPPR